MNAYKKKKPYLNPAKMAMKWDGSHFSPTLPLAFKIHLTFDKPWIPSSQLSLRLCITSKGIATPLSQTVKNEGTEVNSHYQYSMKKGLQHFSVSLAGDWKVSSLTNLAEHMVATICCRRFFNTLPRRDIHKVWNIPQAELSQSPKNTFWKKKHSTKESILVRLVLGIFQCCSHPCCRPQWSNVVRQKHKQNLNRRNCLKVIPPKTKTAVIGCCHGKIHAWKESTNALRVGQYQMSNDIRNVSWRWFLYRSRVANLKMKIWVETPRKARKKLPIYGNV